MPDDDRLTATLGLPRAGQTSRAAPKTGLQFRNAITRRRPLKKQPHFTPGEAVLLPGHSLDQIGPVNAPHSPIHSGPMNYRDARRIARRHAPFHQKGAGAQRGRLMIIAELPGLSGTELCRDLLICADRDIVFHAP
jgi:hypothetical protein